MSYEEINKEKRDIERLAQQVRLLNTAREQAIRRAHAHGRVLWNSPAHRRSYGFDSNYQFGSFDAGKVLERLRC